MPPSRKRNWEQARERRKSEPPEPPRSTVRAMLVGSAAPPTREAAPTPEAASLSGRELPLPETAPARQVAPARETPPVEIASHFAKVPLAWIDTLCAETDPYTQAIYLQLLRLSWGHKRDWCVIGYPRLSERAHVSVSQARRAIQTLTRRGLVERLEVVTSGADQRAWGIRWRVRVPEGTPTREAAPTAQAGAVRQNAPPPTAPMKENPKEDLESAHRKTLSDLARQYRASHPTAPRSDVCAYLVRFCEHEGWPTDDGAVEAAL